MKKVFSLHLCTIFVAYKLSGCTLSGVYSPRTLYWELGVPYISLLLNFSRLKISHCTILSGGKLAHWPVSHTTAVTMLHQRENVRHTASETASHQQAL